MINKKIFLPSAIALALCLSATPSLAFENTPEKQSFNDGWLFSKGEQAGADKVAFDDAAWEQVRLPHDWSIEGPFDDKYNARNGGLPVFGDGWYRKHFTVPEFAANKHVTIAFDGAMYNSEVWVNGQFVGNRPYGYIAFEYDITKFLNKNGEQNVVAVKLSPINFATRWYAGSGLYRDTWIEFNDDVHVPNWGTFVYTPKVTREAAQVKLETEITNKGAAADAVLTSSIKDADGNVVATNKVDVNKLGKGVARTMVQEFTVTNPTLWDIENPYLYSVETLVTRNGKVVDRYETPLGIRHIEYKADDGFWLNWRRMQINGVCIHHDNGPLGAVANNRAIERKIQIMQSMGANSIRTSHNPPSPQMVNNADKLGITLQVEAFDVWKLPKRTVDNGYNLYFDEWSERDLRDMIKQYRNNPSVIMWSIGNEITEQKMKDGWKTAKRLTAIAHDEDPTRLVAAGFNQNVGAVQNKLDKEVDIVGFNYKPLYHTEYHKKNPNVPVLASETSSVTSTRGKYHFPIEKYQKHDSRYVTSYDIIGPSWAYPPDIEFEYLAKNKNVMGEYIWTGFDYLGEPTPYGGRDHGKEAYWNYDWPVRSSSFGAVDLVGFPKDRYFLYQSQWTTKPMVHVLPHWNWAGREGQTIPVYAYTNADTVELFVNGKSMGKKVKGVDKAELIIDFTRWKEENRPDYKTPYRLRWDVKYQPGELKVVATNKGKVVAEKVIKTAGAPAQLVLTPDRTELTADGYDLSYITVDVQDKDGNFVPNADNHIRFFVEGAGEIAAVGNGDSATLAPFKTDYRRAFSGKAMLIVKTKVGEKGPIKVRAYSEELSANQVELTAK